MNIDGFPLVVTLKESLHEQMSQISPAYHALFYSISKNKVEAGVVLFGSLRFGMEMFSVDSEDTFSDLIALSPYEKGKCHLESCPADFVFTYASQEFFTECFTSQLSSLLSLSRIKEYERLSKDAIKPIVLKKFFPIKDKNSIRNILLEKIGILAGAFFVDKGVPLYFFKSAIGQNIAASLVDIYLSDKNDFFELDEVSYRDFLNMFGNMLSLLQEDADFSQALKNLVKLQQKKQI